DCGWARSSAPGRLLAPGGLRLLLDGYSRYQRRTHGMIARSEAQWRRFFANAEPRYAGCVRGGRLTGYLISTFQPGAGGNWFDTDLTVEELVAETPEALAELLAFLRVQADQIRRITIHTQAEYL